MTDHNIPVLTAILSTPDRLTSPPEHTPASVPVASTHFTPVKTLDAAALAAAPPAPQDSDSASKPTNTGSAVPFTFTQALSALPPLSPSEHFSPVGAEVAAQVSRQINEHIARMIEQTLAQTRTSLQTQLSEQLPPLIRQALDTVMAQKFPPPPQ